MDAMVAIYAVFSVAKSDMTGPFAGGWALIYMAKSGETVAAAACLGIQTLS